MSTATEPASHWETFWDPVRKNATVATAVRAATLIFKECELSEPATDISDPAMSAEMLATVAFNGVNSREDSLADKRAVLPVELDRFISLCQRRSRDREPLQYLLGEWDFHGVKIAVRAPVLFLRPPAEKVVDLALEYANRPGKESIKNECHLLDGGCGSGAIIIALLSKMKKWTGVGFDIAEEATKLSEENVERHKMTDRVKIMHCTVAELKDERVFDMFVGCPPYVPEKDLSNLPPEVVNHQDHVAITAGTDGMDVIREFLKHAPRVVRSGGPVFFETYPPLAPKLEAIQVDGIEFVRSYTNLHEQSHYYEWIVL